MQENQDNIKSKILFRFHRGTLAESIETSVELNSKKDLCNIINKSFKDVGITCNPDNINIEFYNTSNKKHWDKEYIVTIPKFGVIGFTNKLLDK